jgi:hypothetical protein
LLSINASKSYGQTGVVFTIDKDLICPNENIALTVRNYTNTKYNYALLKIKAPYLPSYPDFVDLFTPTSGNELQLVRYIPGNSGTEFNYPTTGKNPTTSVIRIYFKVAYWADAAHTGEPMYSNTDSVDVRPRANIQSGFINDYQEVCINTPALDITPITPVGSLYSWAKQTPNSGGFIPIPDQQNNISPTLPSSAIKTDTAGTTYYRLIASYGSECPPDTAFTAVIVDPASDATTAVLSGVSTICYNTTAPSLSLTGPTVGAIQWQYADAASPNDFINMPSPPSVSNTVSRYYRARAKSGVCDYNYSNSILVSISETTRTGSINPITQTICKNGTPTPITLTNSLGTIQWQKSSSPSGPFSDIVGQTGTTLPSASIDNTTTGYYQAVVTSGVCPPLTISSTVIVDQPSLPGTVVLTGNATICYNTTPPTLSLNGPTLGVIQWQFANVTDPTNFIDIGTTTPPTVSNTVSRIYRVRATNGQCTPAYSNEVLVTISQTSNAGTITPVSQTICQGGTPKPILLTGTIVGTIQWQKSSSPSGPFSDIVGQTGTTLPIANIDNTSTGYYQAVVTNGVCPPSIASSTVIVSLPSQAGTVVLTGNATICYQTTPPTLSLTGTNVGIVQWQFANLADPTNFIDIGTTTPPTVSNTNSRIYRVKVTSGACTPAYSNEVLVTISQTSNAGTITPVSQTICQGGTPKPILLTGTIVGTIQWQKSSSPSGPFSDIVGQTGTSLPIGSIDNSTTGYYQAVVTNGVCPPSIASSTVIVSLPSQAGTVVLTGTSTICYNTTPPTLSLTGTNVGVVQWQYANLTDPTNFIDIGTTTPPTVSNTISRIYRVKVTSGACTPAFSNAVVVKIDPLSNAGAIAPTTQTICENMTPTAITLSGSIVGTIQWQRSTSPGGPYNDIIGQVTSTLPSGSISNTTTGYYRALVTSGVCSSAVAYSTVNVVQMSSAGTATITAGNAIICANGIAPTIGLTGSVVGNIQWVDSLVGASPILNNPLGSANPNVSNIITKYYKAIVTNTTYCPSVTSNAILVTINQASNAGTISPVSQSICINGTPNSIVLTNSLGTIQWQSSTTPSSGYTNLVGQTNATLPTASISNTTTNYYQAVVTNGVCPAATITATVIINDPSQSGTAVISGTSTICYGTSILPTISLTGSIVGNIKWQTSIDNSTFTNTTGVNSPTIDNTLSKYYRAVVTSGACSPSYSNSILVEVNQASSAGTISPVTQTICINGIPKPIILNNPLGNIQWQSSTSPSTGYTNIIGQTAITLPSASISNTTTMYYLAVVTNGVCPSATTSATVNVSPATVAGTASISTGTSTICYGAVPSSLPSITLAGYTGTIQWQSSTTNIDADFVNISGVNSPDIDKFNSKYYRAKVTSGACSSLSSNAVYVSVDQPSLAGTISPPTQNICVGSSPTPISLTNYLGTIQWQSSTSTAAGSFTNMTGEITNALAANVIDNTTTKYYQAVVTNGVCPPQISLMSSVIISQLPVSGNLNVTGSTTICYGTVAPGLPTITLTGATGNVQWLSSIDNATYTNTAGILSPTVSPIIDNTITKYYKASLTSGPCPSSETSPILISVDPLSKVGSIIPSQKVQQVCIGSPASSLLNIVLPTHVGLIQWQTTAPSGVYTNMTGLTSATLSNTSISTGVATTTYYRAEVKNGVCPAIFSDIASVQVDAATVAGTISSTSALICNGSTPPTISLTGNTGTTIVWQTRSGVSSPTNIVPAQTGASISSVINTSAPGSVQVVNYYQALVRNGVCNILPTNEVAVAVDPTSQVGLIAAAQKVQQICIGSPRTSLLNVVLPSHVGTIQWQTAAPAGIYSDMTGLTNTILPNTSLQTETAKTTLYRAKITSGVCPAIFSEIASVQVDALSVAGSLYYQDGNSPICNQGVKPTMAIDPASLSVGGITKWLISSTPASTVSVGSAAISLTYIDAAQPGNLLNSSIDNTAPILNSSFRYYRVVVKNGVCPADTSAPKELEVKPTPLIDSVKSNERCGPGTVNLLAYSNLGTVEWYGATTGGTLLSTGNAFTTPNLTSKFNYFYAGARYNGCASLARTMVIAEVIPIPIVAAIPDSTYCGPHVFNICVSATDGGTVNWYTNPTGGTPFNIGNCYNTPLLRANTTYYADAALRGCVTVTRTPINAIIFEVPKVDSIPNFNLCAGNTINVSPYTSLGVPPYTYAFTSNNGSVVGLTSGMIKGIKGGISNVFFNIKDQNNCVSPNSNTFSIKTYDPALPLKFNYQAYYKDDFVIPTKKDSGYILYNWNPGFYLNYTDRPEPIFNGEYTTDYVLVRTDTTSKCMVADNYHIDVTRDFILEVPNAFTPNGDGLNDILRVIANAGIEYVDNFRIINREGLQVFPLNPSMGWDSRNAAPKMLNGVLVVPPDYEHFPERVTPANPFQPNGNRGFDTWDGRDAQGKVLETDGYFWKAIIHFKDNTSKPKSGMFLLLK